MRAISRLAEDNRASAALEFAFVTPVLLTLVFGSIDFGRMFYVRHRLEYATMEAARYYMLNPSTAQSTVSTYLQGRMPSGMGSAVAVAYADTTSCNGNASVTCTTITATYSYGFLEYLSLGPITLRASAQAVRY